MNRDVPPTAGPLPMIDYINLNTPAFALPGSGGGGGSVVSTFQTASIEALSVSSINGVAPGGGGVDPLGISTNQVAVASGTVLGLIVDSGSYITIDSGVGTVDIASKNGGGGMRLLASAITTPDGCEMFVSSLAVSSINGASPGGGGGLNPLISTYQYTTPLTILPGGAPTPLFNSGPAPFTFQENHLYTASWNVAYQNEGAGITSTSVLKFDLGDLMAGDPGALYTAPAYATDANNATLDAFSLTWKQGVTNPATNLYASIVDISPPTDLSTTITSVGNSDRFTLIDYGAV